MAIFETLGLVLFGLLVGAYGAMVGLGGGFLVVPALLVMGYTPAQAAGTSTFVVMASAFSGSIAHLRDRRVDLRSGFLFTLVGLPGAVAGAYIDQEIPHRMFETMFAALLVLMALWLFIKPAKSAASSSVLRAWPGSVNADFTDRSGVRHTYRYNVFGGICAAMFAGFIAALFGIGGGMIYVPSMVLLFNFPAHVAAATSQFVVALTATSSLASHLAYADVRWAPACTLAVGAVIGAQLGARISSRIRPASLMRWLAVALALAGIWLFVGLAR